MFVTSLKFKELLDRFYNQSTFDFMILFVSSFDYADNHIIRWVVDNAKRIDKITGERICFFYFTEERYNNNEPWASPISKWVEKELPLFSIGAKATEETATDICHFFKIERTMLPAFILIGKDVWAEPQLLPISGYEDFEAFLTPLNILHAYIEDYNEIYHTLKEDVDMDEEKIHHKRIERNIWELTTRVFELKAELLAIELKEENDEEIRRFKQGEIFRYREERERLEDKLYQERNLPAVKDRWQSIKRRTASRINDALHCWEGYDIIEAIDSGFYTEAIICIWKHATQRGRWPSAIYENIRKSVLEKNFDIFISCKSEDYNKARKLQSFLKDHNYNPFLADTSILELGNVHQTALIGEVLDICQTMIVLTTNVEYLNTPYVYAEWTAFVNDMNTGRKANAKLFNIIAPSIDIKKLPMWLRDKQCFTIEGYEDEILPFLSRKKFFSL